MKNSDNYTHIAACCNSVMKIITLESIKRLSGLNAGVPISVVSRILGHFSIRQTEQAYAKLLDETISEEIKKRNL